MKQRDSRTAVELCFMRTPAIMATLLPLARHLTVSHTNPEYQLHYFSSQYPLDYHPLKLQQVTNALK